MLLIERDTVTGRATFSMLHQELHETPMQATPISPTTPLDKRDVEFLEWCDVHHHQLRRMLRFMQNRLVQVESDLTWDWDGLESSLARYAYSTSENRRKATPSII